MLCLYTPHELVFKVIESNIAGEYGNENYRAMDQTVHMPRSGMVRYVALCEEIWRWGVPTVSMVTHAGQLISYLNITS